MLTAGVLADRLGRRRVFAAGLGIFTVASALAGLAPDPTFLNLSRALQGVGGAIMFAVSLALVAQEFKPGRDRGVAMGVYGATIGVAVAFGPLVGGALVEGIGWESIFFLNVPIGIAALVVTYARLRETRDPNASRIDWAGLVTFSTALFLLVFGLIRGNEEGWGSTMIVSLLAGAGVLLAVFIAIEARVKEPMLPLHLFKKPAFTGVQLAALAVSASMFSLFLYLTFYLQGFLGHEPLEAGLRYLPLTVANFFVAAATGAADGEGSGALPPERRPGDHGTRPAPDGRARSEPGLDRAARRASCSPARASGMINPVIADVAVSVVPKEHSGMASGINDTFRQVGIAIGIAAWGAIFLGRGASKVEELAAGTTSATGDHPRQLIEAVSSGNLDDALASVPPGSRETRHGRGSAGIPRRDERHPDARRDPGLRGRGRGALAGPRARHRARRGARGRACRARDVVPEPVPA